MALTHVTLETIITDSVSLKHLPGAGFRHAVVTAENAYRLAIERNICPDLATKAGLLHDIGHTSWEKHGEWDFQSYDFFDIHPIKGAERAHELLILKGENLGKARDIALAILFHSGSSPISRNSELTPLQKLVSEADDLDEMDKGEHHNLEISLEDALKRIRRLDKLVQQEISRCEKIKYEECDRK